MIFSALFYRKKQHGLDPPPLGARSNAWSNSAYKRLESAMWASPGSQSGEKLMPTCSYGAGRAPSNQVIFHAVDQSSAPLCSFFSSLLLPCSKHETMDKVDKLLSTVCHESVVCRETFNHACSLHIQRNANNVVEGSNAVRCWCNMVLWRL